MIRVYDLVKKMRSQAVLLAAPARTDPLNGVANRRAWDHELGRVCSRVQRTGGPLVVTLLGRDRAVGR